MPEATAHPRHRARTGRVAQATDDRLLAAVKAGQEHAVALLLDLVREPSLLGEEQGAQARVGRELEALGLEVDRFAVDLEALRGLPGFSPPLVDYGGRENVVGVHRPREHTGRSLILNGHIDVVPTGPEDLWTTPPFAPEVRDGRMYGRGAGDMKAGIACFLSAYRALCSIGLRPAAPVYLQSVIEEECTGNGALACLHRGYRADAAVIPEPFHHMILSAQVGVMWCSITVRGRPAHVFEASRGVNAIEAAFEIYSELKRIEAQWNAVERRHPAFEDMSHPLNFNIGRITGGEWPSSVPCECRFDLRVAYFPGTPLDEVRSAIEHAVRDAADARPVLEHFDARVEYAGFQAEGCTVDTDGAMFRTLREAHHQVLGTPAGQVASTACTDVRFFELYGDTPATCYGPEASHIHAIDESVSIESVHAVTAVLTLFIARWCGLEAA